MEYTHIKGAVTWAVQELADLTVDFHIYQQWGRTISRLLKFQCQTQQLDQPNVGPCNSI